MDSSLRLIFVSVLVAAAWADIDLDVCTPVTQSCGPVVPPLPINFELKGQHVDKLKKSIGYEEVYFDFDNLRAKYMMLSQSIELHLLFDYEQGQIIEYYIMHSGSTVKEDPLAFECAAGDLSVSEHRNIFGYRYSLNGRTNTAMYDSSHALRFGGPYQYAYNGSSDDQEDDSAATDGRGLKWNAFIGCIYEDDMELTALVRYKFSSEETITSSANVVGDIDGSGRADLLSVPLALDYYGSGIQTNASGYRSDLKFDVSQSFSWFRANPVFDNRNLQIPPWMHCDGYRGKKDMPALPDAFSVRLEVTVYSQDMDGKKLTGELVSVDQLYYYKEKGLARRDFTPHEEKNSDIIAKFGNGSPVKEVYDYVSLQVHTINKATGRCYTRALAADEYFSVPRQTTVAEMATTEELFMMEQEDMEYKGQYFSRDIECDVWSGRSTSDELNLTFYKETYITTNGWHFEIEEKIEYAVPVKHTIITSRVEDEFTRTVVESNFFKFKTKAPVLMAFDISECVETLEHKFFAIVLADLVEGKPPLETLMTYKFLFLETAQYYLATVSDLQSPLRIQRIDVTAAKNGVFLTFAILEKNPGTILNPSKGLMLEDAVTKLRSFVDQGNFEIVFSHPETREKIPYIAKPGNFYEWYPGANVTAAKIIKPLSSYRGDQPEVIYERLPDDEEYVLYADPATKAPKTTQQTPKKGMSGGILAVVAISMIVIGIVIGGAVMYLYFRKYGTNSQGNDYVMHQTG